MKKEETATKKRKSLVRTIEILIILAAVGLAFLLRATIYEPAVITSGSMEPTLLVDECILINKACYQFKSPQRGDIIAFQSPDNPKEVDVKRIVALPGDLVIISDGFLFLNGTPQKEPYIKERMIDTYGPTQVPPDAVFVLGDNRNRSEDSRDWGAGSITLDKIRGKVVLVFWPLSHFRRVK